VASRKCAQCVVTLIVDAEVHLPKPFKLILQVVSGKIESPLRPHQSVLAAAESESLMTAPWTEAVSSLAGLPSIPPFAPESEDPSGAAFCLPSS
jgi:hypothetical protein